MLHNRVPKKRGLEVSNNNEDLSSSVSSPLRYVVTTVINSDDKSSISHDDVSSAQ